MFLLKTLGHLFHLPINIRLAEIKFCAISLFENQQWDRVCVCVGLHFIHHYFNFILLSQLVITVSCGYMGRNRVEFNGCVYKLRLKNCKQERRWEYDPSLSPSHRGLLLLLHRRSFHGIKREKVGRRNVSLCFYTHSMVGRRRRFYVACIRRRRRKVAGRKGNRSTFM